MGVKQDCLILVEGPVTHDEYPDLGEEEGKKTR